ncbi:hypothetical protein HAX54_006431 [Datura stramonium]|uniref:Elongator complex protein 6 n=1 Tax=Datura stramonium TaxID=4076 RepID=A0ABS8TCP7_DATST|nr:hypothetical protein [Datura stramonium]
METARANLLEEAVGVSKGGRVVVVEDCVETSGAFVLHHYLKRSLHPDSSDVVVFIAFAHPFSHYERILRKMGCNLTVQRKNHRFVFLDMLTLECPDRNGREAREDGLLALYGEIEKAVEIYSSLEGSRTITIMIDIASLWKWQLMSTDVIIKAEPLATGLASDVHGQLTVLNKESVCDLGGGSSSKTKARISPESYCYGNSVACYLGMPLDS